MTDTAMHEWLLTPTGQYLLRWEHDHFAELSDDVFGYHAVQIGMTEFDALNGNRIAHHWYSDPFLPEKNRKELSAHNVAVAAGINSYAVPVDLHHSDTELPFATESVDLVVLPHTLDFSSAPHHLLREIGRILVPEGQLIVSGFNPTSLWGLKQRWGRMTGKHFLPNDVSFIGLPRMKDWLALLGFETHQGYIGCYCPPCKSDKGFERFSFMEKAGNRWWPYCGAVFMVSAIKRVPALRLIGPAFKDQTRAFANAVSVNQRTVSQRTCTLEEENFPSE